MAKRLNLIFRHSKILKQSVKTNKFYCTNYKISTIVNLKISF